jgi:3-deoxy-D-arabino-heptulosonate 7-phosphate (DAHP) synthase class II
MPKCWGFDGPCNNIGLKLRQNTAYVDDRRNFVIMCSDCFEMNQQYWEEMWRDYWSDKL